MNEDLKVSLDRLHEKQDQQTDKLTSLEVTVAKQEVSMDNYMRQSDRMASELHKLNNNMAVYNAELKVHIAGVMEPKEQNRLMREENKQREVIIGAQIAIALKPIQWASTTFRIMKWSAAVLGGTAAFVTLILKIMGKF